MDSNKYVFKAAALTSAFAAGAALSHLYHLRRTTTAAAHGDGNDSQHTRSSAPSDESALPLLLHQQQQQSSVATAVSSTTTPCGNGQGPGSATATGGGGSGVVGEPSPGLAANGLGAAAMTTPGACELEPDTLLAGVELGGTSCRAAVAYARDPTKMIAIHEVPTTPDANATLSELVTFLRQHVPFRAVGVASFGPVDLDKKSATYGYITTTPKPGWQNVNVLSYFSPLGAPLGFDTDVNAPALAELRYGGFVDIATPSATASEEDSSNSSSSSTSMNSCAYVTVGTGIGVGLVVDGKPVHGLVHPEGGHIMPLKRTSDTYKGWSNIHRDSVESMASARACAERAGVNDPKLLATQVGDDDPVWDDVAYYLAQLCVTVCYVASPHVIVLSGGVMKRAVLFDKIRKQFEMLNEGYIAANKILNRIDEYIVPSKYGNDIGIIGAIELARRAALNMD